MDLLDPVQLGKTGLAVIRDQAERRLFVRCCAAKFDSEQTKNEEIGRMRHRSAANLSQKDIGFFTGRGPFPYHSFSTPCIPNLNVDWAYKESMKHTMYQMPQNREKLINIPSNPIGPQYIHPNTIFPRLQKLNNDSWATSQGHI